MPALRDWWQRVISPQPTPPNDDFHDIEDRVEDQSRRIAALELKIRVIETRIRSEDATRHSKSA